MAIKINHIFTWIDWVLGILPKNPCFPGYPRPMIATSTTSSTAADSTPPMAFLGSLASWPNKKNTVEHVTQQQIHHRKHVLHRFFTVHLDANFCKSLMGILNMIKVFEVNLFHQQRRQTQLKQLVDINLAAAIARMDSITVHYGLKKRCSNCYLKKKCANTE